MRRVVVSIVAMAWLTASSAALAAPVPVQGYLGGLFGLDGLKSPNVGGLVMVDRIRADTARVTTAFSRLLPSHTYRLTFSKATCGAADTAAKRIIRVDVTTMADGTAFTSMVTGADGGAWRNARSVRLMEEEGIYYICRKPKLTDDPGGIPFDGDWSRFADGSHQGLGVLLGRDDGTALRLALDGLKANTRYRLVHSPLTCKQFLDGDPDQPVIVSRFRSNGHGAAVLSRTETVSKDETITIGSNRIEQVSNGHVWACARSNVFVVYLPVG